VDVRRYVKSVERSQSALLFSKSNAQTESRCALVVFHDLFVAEKLFCLQSSAIDVQAMAIAMAACWVCPLRHMTPNKPPPVACNFQGLTLLLVMTVALQLFHTISMIFLCTRPWLTGGTGAADLVSLASAVMRVWLYSIQGLSVLVQSAEFA
jgi:hypothetical protein